MEVFYEYFYELQGYSLGIFITVGILRPYLFYRLNGKRNLQRYYNQAPFLLRIKSKINKTKIGKLNLKTHLLWENFRNKYADKIIFYNQNKLNFWFFSHSVAALSIGLLVGVVVAENFEGFRKFYPLSTDLPITTTCDKTALLLKEVKSPHYANSILDWELKNKIYSDNFEVLDLIQYGKLMGKLMQDEIAYQCYYVAHLKDHKNIKTNSELPFDKL